MLFVVSQGFITVFRLIPKFCEIYVSIIYPKTLKEIRPSISNSRKSPCHMVVVGITSPMDDDLFGRSSSAGSDEQQEPIILV